MAGSKMTESKIEETKNRTDHAKLTGRPAVMKELNSSLIIDALKKSGAASRVELSRITKISQPTVNLLIREMTENGTVLCLGNADSTGGRKAELYALNEKRAAVCCIIASEEGFTAHVYDMGVTEEYRESTVHEEGASYTEELCTLAERMKQQFPQISAFSIGLPGAVSKEGVVYAIPQIPEWEGVCVREPLEERMSVQTVVSNDINATALGYLKRNQEAGKNLIYLQVSGRGLGAGIVIDGVLYPGNTSFAGEVGYMQIESGSDLENLLRDADTSQLANILTGVVINSICVLNPQEIVIGGKNITQEMLRAIRVGCMVKLPKSVLPAFWLMSDSDACYCMGLAELGILLMGTGIHLSQ